MGSLRKSTIYFVRHGETKGNSERMVYSQDDVLTEKGELQAKFLGELIKDETFTNAYASNFIRTAQTAKIILSQSTVSSQIPVEEDARLREKSLGLLEGKSFREVLPIMDACEKGFLYYEGNEVETYADVEARVDSFLQDVFAKIDESDEPLTILIVTHGAFLLYVLNYFKVDSKFILHNWKPEYFKAARNTGYFTFITEKSPLPGKPRDIEIVIAHGKEHLQGLGEETLRVAALESEELKKFHDCVHQ